MKEWSMIAEGEGAKTIVEMNGEFLEMKNLRVQEQMAHDETLVL
jgi:hypothetical protein